MGLWPAPTPHITPPRPLRTPPRETEGPRTTVPTAPTVSTCNPMQDGDSERVDAGACDATSPPSPGGA
jgi:hypothetical protein